MTLIERLIEMETERQAQLRQQIEAFDSGRLEIREHRAGTGWVDITPQSLENGCRQLTELEAMLQRLHEKVED